MPRVTSCALYTPHPPWLQPFYDRATFPLPCCFRGTSIAVLTYIGFDGISTLSEEVENPQRNIPLATVLVCLITEVLAHVEVYAGQTIWPDYSHYPDVDTAFVHLSGRAGGAFGLLINVTLLVATVGSGMSFTQPRRLDMHAHHNLLFCRHRKPTPGQNDRPQARRIVGHMAVLRKSPRRPKIAA